MKKAVIYRVGLIHPHTNMVHHKSIGEQSDFGKIEMSFWGKWLCLYDKKGQLLEKISSRFVHTLYFTDQD